ncbi:YqhG family protein [Baia soyae]|uniref:Uncharacterized protein YqhG n=1 Tax=Baia soyae TaxID=1544746 RepID=A0A4R2S243_9BACL|nr:YqhG family protein [Baia soyae]TCP70598.1 uncharacterized protein YqhG [Baia soyae]
MDQQQVRSFTERYLQYQQCQVIESAPSHIYTHLSIEADKDLLNRPMYWMYVERMGLQPNPSHQCFIFDAENPPADLKGEYVFYGCPRFTQLLDSAQKHGKFVRVYQDTGVFGMVSRQTKPYSPWLVINFFVSFVCDRKRDEIWSLGIDLQTGAIQEQFDDQIKNTNWLSRIPAKRYTEEANMSISEAVGELEYYLQDRLQNGELTWAMEAEERLQQELAQLDLYFPDDASLSEEQIKSKQDRRRELVWQYHPRVETRLINAGLFYRDKVFRYQ